MENDQDLVLISKKKLEAMLYKCMLSTVVREAMVTSCFKAITQFKEKQAEELKEPPKTPPKIRELTKSINFEAPPEAPSGLNKMLGDLGELNNSINKYQDSHILRIKEAAHLTGYSTSFFYLRTEIRKGEKEPFIPCTITGKNTKWVLAGDVKKCVDDARSKPFTHKTKKS